MDDTGRILKPLPVALRATLFGRNADDAIARDLPDITEIDRAHTLNLVRAGVLDAGVARRILDAIDQIEESGFAAFRGREPTRGIYLLWESLLGEILGENAGGAIHLARSRNDLNATALRMRLRDLVTRLLVEALRLNGTILRTAASGIDVLSVGYTQYRPAVPLTVGHQFAGWSAALCRDIGGIISAADDLGRCPLGAGAIGGTHLPIDPSLTADLLGFREPAINSLDAVAARDVVLRILAAASIAGITLSRFATDLQHWSMDEVGFIHLPDELVGSSSMMPQKRNPFLLEHVQSRAMTGLGSFVTAATCMHATPFSNSVAAGTEATRGVGDAIKAVTETAYILRRVIAGIEFRSDAMRKVAQESFINATALADRLVRESGMTFRQAHHAVGSMVNEATSRRCGLLDVAGERLAVDLSGLNPDAVARAARYGGGPGPDSVVLQLEYLRNEQAKYCEYVREEVKRRRRAKRRLRELCRSPEEIDPVLTPNADSSSDPRSKRKDKR